MDIRKSLSRWLLRPEVDRLRALTREVVDDYRMIPYLAGRDPQALIEQLSEADPRLVDLLVRQLRDYEVISGGDTSERFRQSVVKECRGLYLSDPLTQFAVELWTDYAFGEEPSLTAEDETAQAVWDEFWTAERNSVMFGERRLHKLSEDQLIDGELFFVFFVSTVDGAVTCRTIPTEQVSALVRDPEDARTVLYYRRDLGGTAEALYYPDWSASPEQLARAELPAGAKVASEVSQYTDVAVLHAAFREVGGRGWPLATASIDWSRAYKGFLQDRAAVAKAAASVVEKYKVKGGQRAIDAMRRALGSSIAGGADSYEANPPPVAGSGWLENEAVDRQWMNRPTNSADAEKDGAALKKQAALGYKLYPHYLGDGDYYRLATASAMEGPTLKSFNRYQGFWASVWRDMFKAVTGFAERYGSASFASREAAVSSDRILDLAGEDIARAGQALTDLVDRGLIEPAPAGAVGLALLKAALESMGIQGVDEMLAVQPTEAGESQPPFAEAGGVSQFRSSLHSPVYGLWSGKIARGEFEEMFGLALDAGLRSAWTEGLAKGGIGPDDWTQEDETALASFVLEQLSHVGGLADFIEANAKAAGGKLGSLAYRESLWVNAYHKAVMRAFALAQADPPCTWHVGATEESCADCQYANGRTYRKSVWLKWGWETQSQALACKGYNCLCSLDPAEPGTKINKGHPRRPLGHD